MFRKKINILLLFLLAFSWLQIVPASPVSAGSTFEFIEEGCKDDGVPDVEFSIKEYDESGSVIHTYCGWKELPTSSGRFYFKPGGADNACSSEDARLIYNINGDSTQGTLLVGNWCPDGASGTQNTDHWDTVEGVTREAIVLAGGEINTLPNLPPAGEEVPEIGCRAENFGWAICPLVDGALGFVDFMAELIGNFLQVPPVQLDGSSPTYELWEIFRNLSLSLLVIAMLIMVFGQAMSLNIDAYTVKKMLPRIVIAAIAIMLSIYVAAFMVDLFNVLGAGIHELVTAPFGGIDIFVGSFGDLSAVLLAGIATGLVIKGLAVAGFVLVVLIPVAMAFLAVYLTLVLRQIVIIMLIIIAPLAFVAWTIPGTEKYFKTWGTMLVKALMMYPLIMLLLASGQIFAVIVTNVPNGQPGWINTLTALVAMALPLFLVPATFKLAGGAIAMASGAMANMQAKTKQRLADPNDRLGRNLKKQRELHGQKKDNQRTARAMGLHYKNPEQKSGQRIRNRLRKLPNAGRVLQRGMAAGGVLATGAGMEGIRAKDYFAAIGQTEEEMKSQMQKNPYAYQDYIRYGSSRGSLSDRVKELRENGNVAQAEQVERLAGTFGYGNQAASSAMLMTLGGMGKLKDADFNGVGEFYGGEVGDDGRLRFSESQATAAATFGNLTTNAGFAATGAATGQWEYRNAAVVNASAVGADGGGFVFDRNGNEAVAKPINWVTPDTAGFTDQKKADWAIVTKIPALGRVTPDTVEALGPSMVDHMNINPTGAQESAAIKGVASVMLGHGYSTPETMAKYKTDVVDKLETASNPQQTIQLENLTNAKRQFALAQKNAAATGGPTTELAQAQTDLDTARTATSGSDFVTINGETVGRGTAKHAYLNEFNRGQQVIHDAGPS